jgi:hypothetical protein
VGWSHVEELVLLLLFPFTGLLDLQCIKVILETDVKYITSNSTNILVDGRHLMTPLVAGVRQAYIYCRGSTGSSLWYVYLGTVI